MSEAPVRPGLDHSSDSRFRAYYEEKSAAPAARQHFERVRDKAVALLAQQGCNTQGLRVLDIGCNAGTQALVWAEHGHSVKGLDINAPLLDVARNRAAQAGLSVQFDLGTGAQLPYEDGSLDVCLMLELLEHVQDWESCVEEAVRVLAPGGLLYLSTTNALCPLQNEFNLPLYSWYPAALKRRCERLSVTQRPQWVNFTRYPAVHWFTFSQLSGYLARRSMRSYDRFDLIDTRRAGPLQRRVVGALRRFPSLRTLGQVLTVGTVVMAVKPAA